MYPARTKRYTRRSHSEKSWQLYCSETPTPTQNQASHASLKFNYTPFHTARGSPRSLSKVSYTTDGRYFTILRSLSPDLLPCLEDDGRYITRTSVVVASFRFSLKNAAIFQQFQLLTPTILIYFVSQIHLSLVSSSSICNHGNTSPRFQGYANISKELWQSIL